MNDHSQIYAYNNHSHKPTNIHLSPDYLGGSHDLNWEGIIVEKLRFDHNSDGQAVPEDIYYKDYIFAISQDDISFSINDASVDTQRNDIFMTPMNSPFRLSNPNSFTTIMLAVSHDFIKKHFYDKNIDHLKFIKNYRIADNNINFMIRLILEQAMAGTDFNDLYLNQLFTALITYYVNNFSNYLTVEDEHVLNSSCMARINQYIDQNFSNDVTYKDISELSGMSNYSFLNEFKNLTSYTPHQYILQRKLKRAQKLLSASPMTVTEISYELGFTDSSHFSKFFKKHVGVAPSQYRN